MRAAIPQLSLPAQTYHCRLKRSRAVADVAGGRKSNPFDRGIAISAEVAEWVDRVLLTYCLHDVHSLGKAVLDIGNDFLPLTHFGLIC